MRNIITELGHKIRNRRILLGLLQPELSLISGVSIRTIQQIEQGNGNPSLETLIKLADPLGLDLELVLKQPGKIKQP